MPDIRVRFLDLARLHQSIRGDLSAAIDGVVASSSFVGAKSTESFEARFAAAHRRRAAAGCGSGTDALALALRVLGLGHGDEVIVPAMTFVATLEAVVHAGATPVIADVDPVTLLLTPATVAPVMSPRTRAVIPVHLYGHVVPSAHVNEWRDRGLAVVEDAAQAHLACDGQNPIGFGDVACFSFYPGKNLGAMGDGGAVISDDDQVIARIKRLADHGRATKYGHTEIGWCSRLDGLQAAILEAKLQHLPAWTASRRSLADSYRERLGDHLVPWRVGSVHHLLVARVPDGRREDVASRMRTLGIETGVHYPVALSKQDSCRGWWRPCPSAERAASEVLSLPMDPLMTFDDVDDVADAFLASLRGANPRTIERASSRPRSFSVTSRPCS